jgi:transposase
MEIQMVGTDLGKTLFHLVGVDSSGSVVVRKRCSRDQLLA